MTVGSFLSPRCLCKESHPVHTKRKHTIDYRELMNVSTSTGLAVRRVRHANRDTIEFRMFELQHCALHVHVEKVRETIAPNAEKCVLRPVHTRRHPRTHPHTHTRERTRHKMAQATLMHTCMRVIVHTVKQTYTQTHTQTQRTNAHAHVRMTTHTPSRFMRSHRSFNHAHVTPVIHLCHHLCMSRCARTHTHIQVRELA